MKTYIWSAPIRLFHWLLAIGFATAYILGDYDEIHNYHFAAGAFVGTMLFFRLIFGFIGARYAHFRDFPIGFKSIKDFIQHFFSQPKTYAGHNPVASLVMLGIFLIGIFCSISGFLLYSTENPTFIHTNLGEDTLEEIHEICANLFLILVGFHLLGLLAEAIFHPKAQTIKSMLTGYKTVEGENTQLTSFQKTFAIIGFIVPFIFSYLAFGLPIEQEGGGKNTNESEYSEQSEEEEHEDED